LKRLFRLGSLGEPAVTRNPAIQSPFEFHDGRDDGPRLTGFKA